jgi:hypothetical protein
LEVLEAFRSEPATIRAIADCLSVTSHLDSIRSDPISTQDAVHTAQPAAAAKTAAEILAHRYRSVPSRGVLEALAICYGAAIGVCRAAGGSSWRAAPALLDQMLVDGLSDAMIGAFPHCRKGFSCSMYGNVIGICGKAGEWRQVLARAPGPQCAESESLQSSSSSHGNAVVPPTAPA